MAISACAGVIYGLATNNAYQRGFSDGGEKERGAQALAFLTASVAALGVQDKVNASATQHANRQTAADAVSKEIDHELSQIRRDLAYDDLCIGADGVRWLDKARRLANAEPATTEGLSGAPGDTGQVSAVSDPAGRDDDQGAVPDQP